MMEIRTVAVIDNRIFGVVNTGPFALPCTAVSAVLAVFEPWVCKVTQGNGIALDLFLADESGVGLRQTRDDTQRQVNRAVTSACGRIRVRISDALAPDRIR